MTWGYVYTPRIWPSLLTVLLLIALAVYSGRRHSVPGAPVFAVSCLLIVPWVAGSAMEVAPVDDATKTFWFKFQSVWLIPSVTAITCFVLEYAWPGRWLTRRNLVLLSVVPLLALGMFLTNDLHHPARICGRRNGHRAALPDQQDYQGTGVTVEVARRLDVPEMLLIVNKVPAAFAPAEVKARAEHAYNAEVAGVLPHADEMMVLASAGVFVIRYPDHPITAILRQIAQRLAA